MPNSVSCTRLFADENGDSCFEDFEISMTEVQYAPPAPAVEISDPVAASRYVWFRFPADWSDGAHPSPRRQLFIVLAGAIEGWTSKGDKRVFGVGDRLLMEDTTGKGHGARPLNGEALALVIALAQSGVRLNGRSPTLYRIVCEQFFRIDLNQIDPKLLQLPPLGTLAAFLAADVVSSSASTPQATRTLPAPYAGRSNTANLKMPEADAMGLWGTLFLTET